MTVAIQIFCALFVKSQTTLLGKSKKHASISLVSYIKERNSRLYLSYISRNHKPPLVNEEFHPAKSGYLNYIIAVFYMGTSLQ